MWCSPPARWATTSACRWRACPTTAVDYYVAKLVEAGYRVAIAEQITEPGKGLVEREVRRVVTKGTIMEPKMLDERRNNYLMAVTVGGRGPAAGVAYCDITTGEFAATQIAGASRQEVEQRIGEELSRLQPSELIPVDWQPEASSVHNLVSLLQPALSHVEAWQVEPETAAATLRRHFGVSTWTASASTASPKRCAPPRPCWPICSRCSPAR